jgi:hypothetical protein
LRFEHKNANFGKKEMINSVDISELSRQFSEKDYIILPNFLKQEFAESCFSLISSIQDWNLSVFPYNEKKYTFSEEEIIPEMYASANSSLLSGKFSYYFFRSEQASEIFSKDEIKNFVSTITSKEIRGSTSFFASRYSSNCFLSTHTDEGRGKIAIVYNLTKYWSPSWGGNLHILSDKDWSVVRECVIPKFNTLVLFNVDYPRGKPHFVSSVIPNCLAQRYAFSGWYY